MYYKNNFALSCVIALHLSYLLLYFRIVARLTENNMYNIYLLIEQTYWGICVNFHLNLTDNISRVRNCIAMILKYFFMFSCNSSIL